MAEGKRGARQSARIKALFRAEERKALITVALVRFAILAVLAYMILDFTDPPEEVRYDILLIALFAPVGLAQLGLGLARVYWAWPHYIFVLFDAILIVTVLVAPYPFDPAGYPASLAAHEIQVSFSFIFFALVAFSYSPLLMLWFGFCTLSAWAVALSWFVDRPGVLTSDDLPEQATDAEEIAFLLQPNVVNIENWAFDLTICMIVAVGLALVVRRARVLAIRGASAERQRANLARYFSPNVVDELARQDEPLGIDERRDVAVLFCDIVGFTPLTDGMPPEKVLELLRGFHGRMEAQVFAYGGMLEKYIGDAMMAVFGAPRSSGRDACDALSCARAMCAALADWNGERRAAGQTPLRIGIGLHYGPAVTGSIGDARNMAFAVIGSTVNLASRLESLTRALDTEIVISRDMALAVARESSSGDAPPPPEPLLKGFVEAGDQAVKGFDEAVPVLAWRNARHLQPDDAEGASPEAGRR